MTEPNDSSKNANNITCTMSGSTSMEEFVKEGFKEMINATKASNKLPCGKTRDIYEACPSFHRVCKQQGDAVLKQMARLLKHAGCKGNIQQRQDDERSDIVVAANDIIFDRVGYLLDDLAGIRRNPDPEFLSRSTKPISGSWNQRAFSRPLANIKKAVREMLTTSKLTEKPQIHFKDVVDNSRELPFVPRISYKHHLLKPLAVLFEGTGGVGQYSHPYEFELDKLTPKENYLAPQPPKMFPPLNETPFLFVETASDVETMLVELRKSDIIAVDLEHHSYRSFQGFTCLIQISTRQKDFVVDAIALRGDLQPLNEVFTNPKVLKILHGASMDIQWLQRDLSIYVVNMFDTHIAARYLNYPALSLAFLLDRFCDVQAMKQFQLADWRIRPMPEAMMQYAREDTHYLPYVFDKMRNELLEKAHGQDNLLRAVFSESNQVCLTRYVKPIWHDDDYLQIYHKSKRLFDNRQLFALKELYEWRDVTARECDESTGYVLPSHMLFHIAETLPREMQGILACCNPVPPLVRLNLTPIHLIIRKAQGQSLVRPIIDQAHQVDRAVGYGLSIDSPLRCPHDLAWLPEFRPDLPVLLNSPIELKENSGLFSDKAKVTVMCGKISSIKSKHGAAHLTPYQRYKMVKPFADKMLQDEEKQKNEFANKVGENAKDKTDTVEIKIEKEIIIIDEVVPLRKQFARNERKRKSNEATPERGRKKCKTPVMLDNPFANVAKTAPKPEITPTPSSPQVPSKEKKKKKRRDKPATGRKNFDYSAVDYKKFQSNPTEKVVHKPASVKNKHKRTGKKKIKISI